MFFNPNVERTSASDEEGVDVCTNYRYQRRHNPDMVAKATDSKAFETKPKKIADKNKAKSKVDEAS
jgi:hypothetical protein